MKKFLIAACCTLLVAGSVFAQEEAAVPAAPSVPAPVADAAATSVTTISDVIQAPVPTSEGETMVTFASGPVVGGTLAPAAPVQGCNCGGNVVSSTPVVALDPVASAPAADCGCSSAEPAPAQTCCRQPRQRRQILRTALSNRRSRRSACCCN